MVLPTEPGSDAGSRPLFGSALPEYTDSMSAFRSTLSETARRKSALSVGARAGVEADQTDRRRRNFGDDGVADLRGQIERNPFDEVGGPAFELHADVGCCR